MDPGGSRRRGRHASSGDGVAGPPAPSWIDDSGSYAPPRYEASRYHVPPYETGGFAAPGGRRSEVLDPWHGLASRHAGGDRPDERPEHPSAPLPPRPPGVWDRWQPRADERPDDDQTVAQAQVPGPPREPVGPRSSGVDDDATEAHPVDPRAWEDQTGGLEVIGANVDDESSRRWGRRTRRAGDEGAPGEFDDEQFPGAPAAGTAGGAHRAGDHRTGHDSGDGDGGYADDRYADELYVDEDVHADRDDYDEVDPDEIPIAPYDHARARARRRRRPFAVLFSLLVLAGIVVGIVIGGQQLLGVLDPSSRDFTGQGSGTVEVRVSEGDTLSDIARTLVDAGVIASVGPFVDAAEANPAATGIQPGVYSLREEMSGRAALDLMLDPAARLVSRVTIPEGLTVEEILARLAEETGTPIEELQAAADPAVLTLPEYTNGQLEGFLFPATYEIEPDTTPQQMLQRMVDTFTEVAGRLQLQERSAALGLSPYEAVTVASMVQSETRLDEERPDVAQVIYNRLEQGVRLGIDATLAYGLDKSGNELTVSDLETDSPYNTRTRAGLPPTPISSPGEASLEAALAPSSGDLLYYVLESQDGSHFFTSDYAEFQAARQRCAEAGLGCGG